MPRHKGNVIAQREEFLPDGVQQLRMIAPGEVGPANRAGKQHVADESNAIDRMNEHHVSRRVSRAVNDLHRLLSHRHGIVIGQPAIRHECVRTLKAEHDPLLPELTDPEIVIGMRPLDGHTQTLRQHSGLTAMIDVSVCHQDLFDLEATLCRQGLQVVDIAARVDEGSLAGFRTGHQGTVLLEGRDGHNLKEHNPGLSQMPKSSFGAPLLSSVTASLLLACLLLIGATDRALGQTSQTSSTTAPIRSELHTLRLTRLVDGLEHPWSMAWLPDGSMLVTERPGRLRVIDRQMRLDPRPIEGLPSVVSRGQGGLFDIAVHPGFPQNRLVYLAYNAPGTGGFGSALVRARLENHRLFAPTTLFSMEPKTSSGQHFGGRIVFDRQGLIYLTLGDRGDKDRAQRLDDHAGSVIRLHDDGRIPADNPFVSVRGARPEKFTLGHRNIQGAAIHPVSGELWVHEHGPQGGDEINIVRAGRNYGWPIVTFGANYITGTRIGEGTQRAGMEAPIHQWTPSIAVSGMAFYTGNAFPKWRGHLFVGALRGAMLVRLEFDGERLIREERMLVGQIGRIRDVRSGPDGLIYLLTDAGNGALYRLEPAD
jgi:glucose/arabinose dehydrogenase